MKPKISVVTISYNTQNEIERTLLSVLLQTYDNIEYIIVDGGSKDDTPKIIKRYADNPKYSERISFWCSEPDNGIYDAMNKGIDHATGDYIIFMNSGDVFYDHYVVEEVFNNKEAEHADVIFGNHSIVENGKIKIIQAKPFYLSNEKIKGMGICHQSIFLKTEYARRFHFDTKFKIAADYNLIKKVYDSDKLFKQLNMIICIYDTGGISYELTATSLRESARVCGFHAYSLRVQYMMFKRKIYRYRIYHCIRPILQRMKLVKPLAMQ